MGIIAAPSMALMTAFISAELDISWTLHNKAATTEYRLHFVYSQELVAKWKLQRTGSHKGMFLSQTKLLMKIKLYQIHTTPPLLTWNMEKTIVSWPKSS